MSHWKTTLAGAFAAGLYVLNGVLQKGVKLDDWKTWLVPFGLAVAGYLSSDKPTTPTNNTP